MIKKFQGKYRIESLRYRYWDYANDAACFITVCTKNRKEYLGTIMDGRMQLSDIGKIVSEEWFISRQIRQELNLNLEIFTILPDHLHGIIIIRRRDARPGVSTLPDKLNVCNKFGQQSNNISSIIRGFKSAVTVRARKINPEFAWQPGYYDRLIRDGYEFNRIREYIMENIRQ